NATCTILDTIIPLIVLLDHPDDPSAILSIDERLTMFKMVNNLLLHLRLHCPVYHAYALSLIWVQKLTTTSGSHLGVFSPGDEVAGVSNGARDVWGVWMLWKLTEDSSLPEMRFKFHMIIALTTSKNDDLNLGGVGERPG
ncbi:hypothetical protein GYMLUDRAFT_994781, partial [Collybiopsis luxurians FD-317 M1]